MHGKKIKHESPDPSELPIPKKLLTFEPPKNIPRDEVKKYRMQEEHGQKKFIKP